MKRLFQLKLKQYFLFILLFLCTNIAFSQKIEKADTIINMTEYVSYYSYSISAPSFVIYKLYKGGGDVTRSGMSFKEMKDIHSKKIPHFNYTKSGYDRGHLCNAEDMAWSKESLKRTFYYINVIPQHPELNRENWKYNEQMVRYVSQNDSLIIVCGGCDWKGNIGGCDWKGNIGGCDWKGSIPQNCFKVVYSLTDGACIESVIYTNNAYQTYKTSDKLKKVFPYNTLKQMWKGKRMKKFQK